MRVEGLLNSQRSGSCDPVSCRRLRVTCFTTVGVVGFVFDLGYEHRLSHQFCMLLETVVWEFNCRIWWLVSPVFSSNLSNEPASKAVTLIPNISLPPAMTD
ncbi:MAG: hypothetical protein J07HQX50_00526 [Haloquadratum sp. J07HQX50]|nr:MAG: hypothetical protein J07HQX50_00526 [Haloquadratum sp. J07HQX50]